MAEIVRRIQRPPRFRDYQLYKPFLRIDFTFRCAYCRITEARWGSDRNFAVEHFRPKNQFPALALRYSNLYYACNRCNDYKGNRWPSPMMSRRGFYFADPCRVDVYATHVEIEPEGKLKPRTRCGEYTIAHLNLNRPLLVEWRREARLLQEDIEETAQAVQLLRGQILPGMDEIARGKLEALITRHLDLCERLRACY